MSLSIYLSTSYLSIHLSISYLSTYLSIYLLSIYHLFMCMCILHIYIYIYIVCVSVYICIFITKAYIHDAGILEMVLWHMSPSSTQHPGQWGSGTSWDIWFSEMAAVMSSPGLGCSMILAGSGCLTFPCSCFSFCLVLWASWRFWVFWYAFNTSLSV